MSVLLPGAGIGILGGGQLARMMVMEARRLGYRTVVLDPSPDSPGGQMADVSIRGALDDLDAAKAVASQCDVVTLDTEHVPAGVLRTLETIVPVRPSARVLAVVQDRLEQRRYLEAAGVPQVRYAPVDNLHAFETAAALTGLPGVLKTRRWGYDGRGQARVGTEADLLAAWNAVGQSTSILESYVAFEREISVLLARGLDGDVRYYPIAENEHRRHILHTARVPARVSESVAGEAREIARVVAEGLEYVGLLAVELFVDPDGGLLVNEIAPRTHNSGHFTLGACVTSQFEQHVRAICGLPLGETSLLRPCVMLNVLGDAWQGGAPDWGTVLTRPNVSLHLYGKKKAVPGRKMGHLLIIDEDIDRAAQTSAAIAELLERPVAELVGEHEWTS